MSSTRPPHQAPGHLDPPQAGPFAGAHDALRADLRGYLLTLQELLALLERVPPALAAAREATWHGAARTVSDLALSAIETRTATVSDLARTARDEYVRALAIVEANL